MKHIRIGIIALFAALPASIGAFSLNPTLVMAQSANPTCAITQDDLAAVTAAASEGLLAELSARRALLVRTITCAKSDAETLQNSLNAATVPDDAKALRSQLSGKLDDAMTYYDLELGKVSGAGIAGTQAIAKEVLGWRSSNYEMLAGQVENFILWSGNQDLFAAAGNRLGGIANLVGFLEQAGQQNELQSNLAAAQTLMQAAMNENQAAKNALLQSLPPDQSLALIQQSLKTLSDTYQKFFDIATLIQSILPATKTQ